MSRAEKRRQQKLAGKAGKAADTLHPLPLQQTLNIDAALTRAMELHKAGDLPKAKSIYDQTLRIDPNQPVALHLLGILAFQVGDHKAALALSRKAISINPDYNEAYTNIGHVFQSMGNLEEAVDHYNKALALNPDCTSALTNLVLSLNNLCKFEEAVQTLQIALERNPGEILLTDPLILLLNMHTPKVGKRGPYIKAQDALRQVPPPYAHTQKISDEAIQDFFQQCYSILASHNLSGKTSYSQVWRGSKGTMDCERHMKVFDTFNTIPEFCFGCYKVLASPRTVMEFFKLYMVFDGIELAKDTPRKCHIEYRQKISGTYKGTIYCDGLEDAKEISNILKATINDKIGTDIPVSIKKGCSEFPLAYPEFGNIDDNSDFDSLYTDKWRENEDYTDENLVKDKYPSPFKTHNHTGTTLRDTFIMLTWLAYAATIEDQSYLNITGDSKNIKIEKRPEFQSIVGK